MAEATVSRTTYYLVTAALIMLLILTYGVYHLQLGAWGIVVAMTIAFSKALLILLFFMHVRYSSNLTKVAAFAGVFWLSILFLLTFSDYFSRSWLAVEPWLP